MDVIAVDGWLTVIIVLVGNITKLLMVTKRLWGFIKSAVMYDFGR